MIIFFSHRSSFLNKVHPFPTLPFPLSLEFSTKGMSRKDKNKLLFHYDVYMISNKYYTIIISKTYKNDQIKSATNHLEPKTIKQNYKFK